MRSVIYSIYIILCMNCISGCIPKNENPAQNLLKKEESFRKELKGKKVDLYTLTNQEGVTVQITNYGGKIVSIIVPDKYGNYGNVCLGYDSLDQYINGSASIGATMGPMPTGLPMQNLSWMERHTHLIKTMASIISMVEVPPSGPGCGMW